jgi:hypothetical protein
VEEDAVDEQQFEEQRRTYLSYGYALDPSTAAAGQRRFIGNVARAAATDGATVFHDALAPTVERKKRKTMGNAADDPFNYEGPWAGYEGEQMHLVNDNPVRKHRDSSINREIEAFMHTRPDCARTSAYGWRCPHATVPLPLCAC